MRVSAWYGGTKTHKSYGIRLKRTDRDQQFYTTWSSVTIELDTGEPIEVSISASFWRSCIELRHPKIGHWLMNSGLIPWPKGHPPHFNLEPLENRRFRLTRI